VLLFGGLSYVGAFRRTAPRNSQPSLPPAG
jgi:hypothetical protein